MLTLSFYIGDRDPLTVDLPPGVYTMGSASDDTIVVNLPEIDAKQLQFRVTESLQLFVTQTGTAGELMVNDQSVQESFVKQGDVVRFGPVIVMVDLPGNPDSDEDGEGAKTTAAAGFWSSVARSFGYPFRGESIIMVVVLVVIGVVANLLPGVLGFASILVGFAIGIFIVIMFRDIVHGTINGEDQMPKEPDVTLDWDQLREIVVPLYAIILFPMLPSILGRVAFPDAPDWVVPALAAAGILYIPMALLLFLVTEEFFAAHPWNVLVSALRAPFRYGMVVAFMLPIVGLGWLEDAIGSGGLGRNRILAIASIGGISLFQVYFLFVWGRVLGLFYRHHRYHLGWE